MLPITQGPTIWVPGLLGYFRRFGCLWTTKGGDFTVVVEERAASNQDTAEVVRTEFKALRFRFQGLGWV